MIKIHTLFSVIVATSLLFTTSFADELPNAGNFILAGRDGGKINTSVLVDKMDDSIGPGLVSILQLLYQIGIIVAICVLVFMGIKILIASPQQKAQLKAGLLPYFTGLLLFIAGVPIAILIINIILSIF